MKRALRVLPQLIRRTASMAAAGAPSASDPKLGIYVATADTPVAILEAKAPFASLTEAEARYASAIAAACWAGYKITLLQTSREAPPLFELLRAVFADGAEALRRASTAAGVAAADVDAFVIYAATVLENCGPYRSFGDTKILPALAPSAFEAIVRASPAAAKPSLGPLVAELWDAVKDAVYDVRPRVLQLGMAPGGVTTYYSSDMTEEDAALIGRFVKAKALLQPYNTRVFKVAAGGGVDGGAAAGGAGGAAAAAGGARYVIRLASSLVTAAPAEAAAGKGKISGTSYDDPVAHLQLGDHAFEGATISIVRGDYAPLMARVSGHVAAAQAHAANDTQVRMLSRYLDHFRTGSQEAHVDA
jgi:dipeptidyl-peptidase-3